MGRTDSKAVFWSDSIGYQYTIANLTAALALAQVERIEELIKRKQEIYDHYRKRLLDITNIKLVKSYNNSKSVHCYPSILLDNNIEVERDIILNKLEKLNIHCRPAFPRMSTFPIFEARFDNPIASVVEKRGISLPSAANLNEEDIDFVCNSLRSIIS